MKVDFLTPAMEADPFCWLMEFDTLKVGVHRRDGWCCEQDGEVAFLDDAESVRWLVGLVETPVEVFSAFLETSALSMPAYAELIRRFPIGLLLKHIFHYYTWSDYWGERALNWLGANGLSQAEFRGELEAFMSNKAMPQNARHRARKMLRYIPG